MPVRTAWATCVALTGTASTDVPWSCAAKAWARAGGPVTSTRVPARNERRASSVSITDPIATPIRYASRSSGVDVTRCSSRRTQNSARANPERCASWTPSSTQA